MSTWTKAKYKPWFANPAPHPTPSTATVIGAGLAGCAIAYHLAQKGWKVTLLEQYNEAASATSSMPAGIIKPKVDAKNSQLNQYYQRSYHYFISYLQDLLKSSPNIAHRFCGVTSHIEQTITAQSHFSDHSGWLSPRGYCHAQIQAFDHINLITNVHVTSTIYENNQWHCLQDNGTKITSSEILIHASGWSLSKHPDLHCLKLKPLSGQISSIKRQAIPQTIQHVIANQHYLIPYSDETLIIGASHHSSDTAIINDLDHMKNLQGLQKLIPNSQASLDDIQSGQVGIRTTSNDHQAIIGSIPKYDFYTQYYKDIHHGRTRQTFPPAQYFKGLYVIGALGSHGLSSSAYLGRLLSEIIAGGVDSEQRSDLELLHPARFLIRGLKKNSD